MVLTKSATCTMHSGFSIEKDINSDQNLRQYQLDTKNRIISNFPVKNFFIINLGG